MAEQQLYKQSDISDSVLNAPIDLLRRAGGTVKGLAGKAYDAATRAYGWAIGADKAVDEGRRNTIGLILKGVVVAEVASLVPSIVLGAEPSLEELAKQWNMPLARVQEIYKEMHQPVADTLKGTSVREVTPYNYDKSVIGSGRPGLVLFYGEIPDPDGSDPSRGLASVYRVLEQQFAGKVNLFVYNALKAHNSKKEYERLFARKHCSVTDVPSVVLYAEDGGSIKAMDILNGGFSKTKLWKQWLDNLVYWLNIYNNPSHPNFRKYAFKNTSKWHKI